MSRHEAVDEPRRPHPRLQRGDSRKHLRDGAHGRGQRVEHQRGAPGPGRSGRRASRRPRSWVQALGGGAVLAVLVWRLGTGPLVGAVRTITVSSLAVAVGIGLVTTLCCSWRWRLVSRGLGVALPLRSAVAAYYRSQFLNLVLPGGVLGDVHRAVDHGREVGDVGRGLRVVAWERSAGQAVQLGLAVAVMVVVPSPARAFTPVVVAALAAVVLAGVLLSRLGPHDRPSVRSRLARAVGADLRSGVLSRRRWPGIVLASTVVVVGHAATFVVAARTTGSTVSPIRMLPLAVVVLMAMGLPASIAGWGPREAVAAWTSGLAGLSAAEGAATAVVYGVMVLVASLPGAGVLIATGLRRRARRARETSLPEPRSPVIEYVGGAAHG